MQSISDRMKIVINAWLPQRGRFKKLEEISEIPADHWKNFWHGKQRAHEYMIQSLARTWPEFALWLVTGIYEEDMGQTLPSEQGIDRAVRSIEARILLRKITIDEQYNKTTRLSVLHDSSISEKHHDQLIEKLAKDFVDQAWDFPDETDVLLSKDSNKLENIFKSDEILNDLKQKRASENK